MISPVYANGTFWGQWIGSTDDQEFRLRLDIDRATPERGNLNIFSGKGEFPEFCCRTEISFESEKITATLNKFGVYRRIHEERSEEVPKHGRLSATVFEVYETGKLGLIWGDIEIDGFRAKKFELRRAERDEEADWVDSEVLSWAQFREKILNNYSKSGVIYRGQSNKVWPLKTSFHRTDRRDLSIYNQVLNSLSNHFAALLSMRFEAGDIGSERAILALAQHHGFPTPLMDWTRSPFIAAFFAFRNLSKREEKDINRHIRIFAFSSDAWVDRLPNQMRAIDAITPTFIPEEPYPLANDRVLPQQSVFILTNLSDAESFIKIYERDIFREKFLWRFDIPASERPVAMRDLEKMGIGGSSMFPGLDGVCESLKENFFRSE